MARRKTTPEVPDYLTAAQVADRLQVSKQALSYWRAKDSGPLSIKVLGNVRYPRAEFEAWLIAQTETTARGEKVSA